jgi:hypothetical protein
MKLRRCIHSICSTATSGDFEILVRYDNDDGTMRGIEGALAEYASKLKFFVGPRHGYGKLDSHYYADLEDKAIGQFIWIMNDDVPLDGDWIKALSDVPLDGYIVQPEITKLGKSVYHRAQVSGFPIYPRYAWKKF